MIVKGSINYTPSGRRKKNERRKIKRGGFEPLPRGRIGRTNDNSYPSREPLVDSTTKGCVYPAHSKTVAIAFNKGPYQVIPEAEIKYIGK